MQDPDTPPEVVEEVETDVGGDGVRLMVVVVGPVGTLDLGVAGVIVSNRAGSSPLPWTITTATMAMVVHDQVGEDAAGLAPPICSPIPSRCPKPAKTRLPKYLPSSMTYSFRPRSRKRPAR